MKKYVIGIGIAVIGVLAAILIAVVMLFSNMKEKVTSLVDQVKSGEYVELVKQNTENLIPESLKNLQPIEDGNNQCEYFYQKVDTAIEYLKDNPDITGAEVYADQLTSLKNTIEKTPSIVRDTACQKGISSLNYIIETIGPNKE